MDNPPEESRVPVWVLPANVELVQAYSDFCDIRAELHLAHSLHVTHSSTEGIAEPTPNAFVQTAIGWDITYGTATASVTDLIGIRCIAQLVSRPNTRLSVLELGTLVRGTTTTTTPFLLEQYHDMLDPQARAEIRAEASLLQEKLNEAQEQGNRDRADEARAEIEALEDSVRGARGRGGRSRAFADAAEQARQAMSRSVGRAYAKILPQAPTLVAHLKQAVKIGRFCSYTPVPTAEWAVTKRRL